MYSLYVLEIDKFALTNEEIYVPVVITEPIQEAIPIQNGENPFADYRYSEEKYDDTVNTDNVKVIKLK